MASSIVDLEVNILRGLHDVLYDHTQLLLMPHHVPHIFGHYFVDVAAATLDHRGVVVGNGVVAEEDLDQDVAQLLILEELGPSVYHLHEPLHNEPRTLHTFEPLQQTHLEHMGNQLEVLVLLSLHLSLLG
jgi:hypothetical protein